MVAPPDASRGSVTTVPSRIAHQEDTIQAALLDQVRVRGVKGLVYLHIPNSSKLGGKRTRDGVPLEAIRLKRLGFRKGASDLLFLYCARVFFLELKTLGTYATKEQREFLADCEAQGANVAIAHGIDHAIRQLESWGLLRGQQQ